MSVIQPKRTTVIQKGTSFSYNAATFKREHTMENSYETNRAEDVYKLIKPFELMGRKFLVMDTEDYPADFKSHDTPKNHVRRWIGSGKKATPVDLPFCMSFCDGINMITLYDSEESNWDELRKMSKWLEDPTIEIIFHNTKFDMHMLANIGLKFIGKLHDTIVLAKLVNENRSSFMLKTLAEKELGGVVKYEYMVDAYKKLHKIADYRHIPRELMTQYANADVWNAYLLFVKEYPMLVEQELEGLYDEELQLMMVVWTMERIGMKVNPEYEQPLKQDLQKLSDEAEKAIYEAAGKVFNINSTKQIYEVLMSLGVSPTLIKKTDKGNPKLNAAALEDLAEKHGVDIVQKILDYRRVEKLLGTYAVGIYDQRDSNYMVHSNINQTEATTGRMSITKPALQTLPKKDTRIRKAFVPNNGYKLWFMDLDQVEYRLFAHYAKATDLIKQIKEGYDVHAATGGIVFNKPVEEVTDDERSDAKTLNFSLVYGQGDSATARSLRVTISEARKFKAHYFAMIPEAEPFIKMVHRVVRSRGFVKNFFGRKRRLKYDEAYKAPNALIQGAAADYIKSRLVLRYKFLLAHAYKTRMINVVHDEVVDEIHETEEFLVPKLRWLLSDFKSFRVPITAGAEVGTPSWGEKVEPEDVGFEELTEEEWAKTLAFDVFDGSAFDIVREA